MEQFIQENMKIIRNILGHTQTELADKLGVTRQHLGKVESKEVELQRTLSIAFITVVMYNCKQLDKESMTYELMSVYLNEFETMILKMV